MGSIALGSVRLAEPETRDEGGLPELAPGEFSLDEDSLSDQALDAFIEGKKRPQHLVD